jgi:DNA-binding MarR family transcriptional regulator
LLLGISLIISVASVCAAVDWPPITPEEQGLKDVAGDLIRGAGVTHLQCTPSMAAVTSIMRAQQILLGELDALLRPYGLTFARYEALVLLTFSRRGALPLGVIGERLMVHPTSVTNIISRLERQQMVVRRPNPSDGRGRLAEITDAGRDVVERATRDLMAAEFGLGGYDPGQLKEIFDLFLQLRLAAGDFVPETQDAT